MSDLENESDLLSWPRPDLTLVPDERRQSYQRYVDALTAVVKGSTVRDAARSCKVNRNTLERMARLAPELAEDGRPWGFRVCVPWRRTAVFRTDRITIPDGPGANAFIRLLLALPVLAALLRKFKGRLPARSRPSRTFDDLMRQFKALLLQADAKDKYPLNTPDGGRRAVLRYIARERLDLLATPVGGSDGEEVPSPALHEMLALQPLDRVETDGHKTDVNWRMQAPLPDGTSHLVSVPCIWLLAMIDSVSLVVYAWKLVVARKYSERDLLELHARALTPWHPRVLVSPDMQYDPQAWMPSAGQEWHEVTRPVCDAMDNDSAHTSKLSTENLSRFQLGLLHLGPAGVPQGRPHIEAFFKMIEERVYRRLAGGFRPAGEVCDAETAASFKHPDDYPVDLVALEDLTDVVISKYHVTPHAGLQGRTPREVHEAFLAKRTWVTRTSQTAAHVKALRTLRKRVTIRGSEKKRVLPHVRWEGATYRATRLNDRYDLIGTEYVATAISTDVRMLTLLDPSTGEDFIVLRALPPWDQSPHDLDLRRRALRWRDRGLLKYDSCDDAATAYHLYVRDNAWRDPSAAEALLKQRASPPAGSATPRPPAPSPLTGVLPRGGAVSFLRPKTRS